jgi:hypothetical protein
MAPPLTQRALPLTVLVLSVFGVAVPSRAQRWAGSLGGVVRVLEAPISGPLRSLTAWLSPPRVRDDERVASLHEQLEHLKGQVLQVESENRRLRQMLADLRIDPGAGDRPPVRQVPATIIGASSDPTSGLLTARAGTRDGVEVGAVAVAPGLQVVGKVVAATERTSTIRPITSRGADPLACFVVTNESTRDGLRCTLSPGGEGSLRGPVVDRRDPATGEAVQPAIDMPVRLDDAGWPAHLRLLLVVGRVAEVGPSPDQPLRRHVVVRPTIADLERVTDVTIWVAPRAEAPR